MVLSELKKPQDPTIMQHLCYRQVQRFKPLAEVMSRYRMGEGK